MKFAPRVFSLLLLFSASLQPSRQLAVNAQTPKATEAKAEAPAKADDYSQEAVVLEQLKTAYRFEKDGTGTHELAFRAKVQNEAAVERLGQLVFPYSSANEKLDIDFVRVRKPS